MADQLPINPEWEVHPAAVQESLAKKEDFLLLDVRRPGEWTASHLEGAVLIPMQELGARLAEIEAWKEKRIVAMCHHGVRSLRVTAFLRDQGFADVKSMAGGIEAYSVLVDPNVPRY